MVFAAGKSSSVCCFSDVPGLGSLTVNESMLYGVTGSDCPGGCYIRCNDLSIKWRCFIICRELLLCQQHEPYASLRGPMGSLVPECAWVA